MPINPSLRASADSTNCHCGSDEQMFGADEQVRGQGSERLGHILINAQIGALLVAEFVQKSACLSKKKQLTPGPFSRCDFRLRQARFHSEERPMEGRKLYDLFKVMEPPRE